MQTLKKVEAVDSNDCILVKLHAEQKVYVAGKIDSTVISNDWERARGGCVWGGNNGGREILESNRGAKGGRDGEDAVVLEDRVSCKLHPLFV